LIKFHYIEFHHIGADLIEFHICRVPSHPHDLCSRAKSVRNLAKFHHIVVIIDCAQRADINEA
jgi:hypothetical protein